MSKQEPISAKDIRKLQRSLKFLRYGALELAPSLASLTKALMEHGQLLSQNNEYLRKLSNPVPSARPKSGRSSPVVSVVPRRGRPPKITKEKASKTPPRVQKEVSASVRAAKTRAKAKEEEKAALLTKAKEEERAALLAKAGEDTAEKARISRLERAKARAERRIAGTEALKSITFGSVSAPTPNNQLVPVPKRSQRNTTSLRAPISQKSSITKDLVQFLTLDSLPQEDYVNEVPAKPKVPSTQANPSSPVVPYKAIVPKNEPGSKALASSCAPIETLDIVSNTAFYHGFFTDNMARDPIGKRRRYLRGPRFGYKERGHELEYRQTLSFYKQEYTIVQAAHKSKHTAAGSRRALCPYCYLIRFVPVKAYACHMFDYHGITSDNYVVPDPFKSRKPCSSGRHVICPVCAETVHIDGPGSDAQPHRNYLRHFRTNHYKAPGNVHSEMDRFELYKMP